LNGLLENILEDTKFMETTIFIIIIAILIFDFVFGHFLKYLNTTRWSNTIPTELKGIYNEEKYAKQQEYEKVNYKFSIITSVFSFVLILLVLFFDGFAYIDTFARSFTDNAILVALLFFGILMFASDILNTPFSIYDTFVIEEKFGFNKTTPKTYFFDKIKGWLISALLGGGILSLIIWFYIKTGSNFWIYGWLIVATFTIFMAMFYSNLIVPLFNKQKPLEEGELRDEIEAFSTKAGFKLKNIFVIDGSKRSTKANAYFTGLGAKKTNCIV
jgi:STE24 endopeptidase